MKNLTAWYYSLEFNLITVPRASKGKDMTFKWKQYQREKAPKLPENYKGNVAVVLGSTSKNDLVVDVDDMSLFNELRPIMPDTLTIKGHRGGHFHYRGDGIFSKRVLIVNGKKVELLCQGQFSMLPPSIHPKGIQYEFINKREPAHWSGDFVEEFTVFLREHGFKVKIERKLTNIENIMQGVEYGDRDEAAIRLATWHRMQGKTEEETFDLMLEWNERNKPPMGEHPNDQQSAEDWIKTKVQSAFRRAEPYPYKFKKDKTKPKYSCGQDLPDKVFEQINSEQFLVYDKVTAETSKQKVVEGFKPFERVIWRTVNDIEPYESELELWNEVKQYIYDHIDIPEGYDVLTAWVFASWIPEKWHAVPYLFFYGPAASGKTWALEVLASIGFRPFLTASTSLASIFRVIDQWHPTTFLDETETYMKKDSREIMHILNSGYRKGFPATRVEDTKEGFKVKFFDCFGFKALAGTREFAKTLKSRCIIFNMSKATRKIETTINIERAKHLQRKLLMWRFDRLAKKEKMESPNVLTGRLRELFDPLIMVAPTEAKNSIINEAKKIEKMTTEEELTSDEAIVFKAIYDIHEETHKRKITIEEITELVNENFPVFEPMSNVSIGWTLSRLGFKKTLYKGKRAIYWNEELGERLKRRYLTDSSGRLLTDFSARDVED